MLSTDHRKLSAQIWGVSLPRDRLRLDCKLVSLLVHMLTLYIVCVQKYYEDNGIKSLLLADSNIKASIAERFIL